MDNFSQIASVDGNWFAWNQDQAREPKKCPDCGHKYCICDIYEEEDDV